MKLNLTKCSSANYRSCTVADTASREIVSRIER